MSFALFRTDSADPAIGSAIEAACARIAPAWPLDQSIAVNPLWGWIDEPVPAASRRIETLSGSRLLMPRAEYAERWRSGQLREEHLRAALELGGEAASVDDLVAHLLGPETPPARRALVTDVADAFRDTVHGVSWCDFVAHTLSQHCAAFFDAGQAQLGPDRRGGLHPAWLRSAHHDWSPRLLMGLHGYGRLLADLPSDPYAAIAETVALLRVPALERASYFTALLMRVNGWAAWCAYRRFVARSQGEDDDQIVHLLALRLAWESILYRGVEPSLLADHWSAAMASWRYADRAAESAQRLDWVIQRALELAYQEPLAKGLARSAGPATSRPIAGVDPTPRPAAQIAFCIDVRSEVFRRALEAVAPQVGTLGFAGFFGVPIDYQPLGSASVRPQLPGPLAPSLRATDQGAPVDLAARRAERLDRASAWKALRSASVSAFSFVESAGWLSAASLVGLSRRRGRPGPLPDAAGLRDDEKQRCKPRLAGPIAGAVAGGELPIGARADLAAGILRAMSLPRPLARLVVLAGHGSQTVNNPQAAALDCGACCGQTGEVNARAAAALLNEPAVREALSDRGLEIPADTRFVAALHDTTVDRFTLYDLDELPASHADEVARLGRWLDEAGHRARRERAPALGLAALADDGFALADALEARARDWSELRPEWGLANNAAFVVAPRARTRALDLGGRSFLHEYRWEEDRDFGVLELILTAPMVVTHWINFQYYASTVDNRRWGSGDKTLHNVVGARLGVFEGNGGDLRIGLSRQSLHDGQRWRHTPLRLSVFVEAPRAAIDRILAKHERVRQLVENEWLFLFQIDPESGGVFVREREGWRAFTPVAEA